MNPSEEVRKEPETAKVRTKAEPKEFKGKKTEGKRPKGGNRVAYANRFKDLEMRVAIAIDLLTPNKAGVTNQDHVNRAILLLDGE